ncbi:MAG TPA: hypothetical protein VIL95_08280 [Bacillota bacterium]
MGSGTVGNEQQGNPETVKVSEIEQLLTRIPGILAARLVVDDWGAIEEIHILATTERGPKQLVRDVESALTARWGIKVDHKKISVAQLEQAETPRSRGRLRLRAVTASAEFASARYQARVELSLEGDDELCFSGSADGANLASQQPRIVAAATLAAFNQAVRPGYHFALEEASIVRLTGRELAVVLFALYGPKGDYQLLAGARPVLANPVEATVQACLQGANRLLERLLRQPGGGA